MENTEKKNQTGSAGSVKNVLLKIWDASVIIAPWIYQLRKVLLAIPVVFGAIYLARVNWNILPEEVGFSLMANGQFAQMVSRETAVYGPMALTAVCLVLMVCSRRAFYPWLISLFTLALPLLILITNIFPS